MKWIVIIISLLSAIVAIYPIIFEGALKKRNKNEPRVKIFKAEFSRVNSFGWGLIVAIINLNFLMVLFPIET
jgi:hypothetical protein